MMNRIGAALLSVSLVACADAKPQQHGASSASSARAATSATLPAPSQATSTRPVRAPASAGSSAAPKPAKKARYQKLTDEEVKETVQPHLPKGAKIAHPPYRGPFGPSQQTVVVITNNDQDDFAGFVLVERKGKTEKMDLPVLQESWPGVSVEALGFLPECDGDPVEELVVISRHKSAGGTATVATAFDFDGESFRRLDDVAMLAAKAKTVSEVRELLETRTFIMHVDGVPVRILPTVRPKPLRAYLEKLMGVEGTWAEGVLTLAYAEKKGAKPAEFAFTFNASNVLQKITVSAVAEQSDDAAAHNPTGSRLAARLAKEPGKGKVNGTTTTWEHNGWTFVLDAARNEEGAYHRMEARPLR